VREVLSRSTTRIDRNESSVAKTFKQRGEQTQFDCISAGTWLPQAA